MEYIRPTDIEIKGQNSALAPLPCLNSNISTENPSDTPESGGPNAAKVQALPPRARLSTQHKKSAFILKESVQLLSEKYGLQNLGFLTLTFKQHILDPKEAQRRLNSLITHVIKPRYSEYLGVMERQKSGRIHYHLLVVLGVDIRSGFNFDQVQFQNYKSASPELRKEWSFWRRTAPKYGFGRTELMPIKSNTEAIAKYVGKYISKHIEARTQDDKGVRLVRYSKGARAGTTRFQFQSPGSQKWRQAVAVFAQTVQNHHPERKISELSDLSEVLGKRWAYHHRDIIIAIADWL